MYCGWNYVTDCMKEKLDTLINDEFSDWQTKLSIDDGGLSPELEYKLNCAVDTLLATFNECVTWQAASCGNVVDSRDTKIDDVKTIYTGGGIFEYIAQLNNGTWGMFDDDDLGRGFLPIVDREPTEDDWHSEFFEEHDAGYLLNEEATELMREVLEQSTLNEWERAERIRALYEIR